MMRSNEAYRLLSVPDLQFYVALLVEKLSENRDEEGSWQQFYQENQSKKHVTKLTLRRFTLSSNMMLTRLELQILSVIL
jgi:hypothetical protein